MELVTLSSAFYSKHLGHSESEHLPFLLERTEDLEKTPPANRKPVIIFRHRDEVY